MKSLQHSIDEARASRAELQDSLRDVGKRLTLPELAEDALRALDPKLTILGRVKTGIQRQPLFASALLAGAGWLVSSMLRTGSKAGSERSLKFRRRKIKHGNSNLTQGDQP